MARYLLGAVALFAAGFASAAEKELHVVALYEGHGAPRDHSTPGTASIKVDRPGKEVVLVVSAYESVVWEIAATPKTKLTKVILGGSKLQSARIPRGVEAEEMSAECERQRILPVSIRFDYKMDSPRFRYFAQVCHKYTGLEISSFQGAYRFDPEKPFVVDAIQKDERLSSDFPKLTPAAQVPNFKFQATSLVADERGTLGGAAYGNYTQAGPKDGSFVGLPKGILQVAYDPAAKQYYGISGHDLHRINVKDGTSEKVNAPPGINPNWLRALTHDAKRDRLIITGRNALYEYSIKNRAWTILLDRDNNKKRESGSFSAIAWQKSTDTLFAIAKEERDLTKPDKRDAPVLYELNPNGMIAKTTYLGSPMFTAVMDGGANDRAELIDLGGNLAAIIYRENRDSGSGRRGKPETFLYVIDPKTGKVQLAWKE